MAQYRCMNCGAVYPSKPTRCSRDICGNSDPNRFQKMGGIAAPSKKKRGRSAPPVNTGYDPYSSDVYANPGGAVRKKDNTLKIVLIVGAVFLLPGIIGITIALLFKAAGNDPTATAALPTYAPVVTTAEPATDLNVGTSCVVHGDVPPPLTSLTGVRRYNYVRACANQSDDLSEYGLTTWELPVFTNQSLHRSQVRTVTFRQMTAADASAPDAFDISLQADRSVLCVPSDAGGGMIDLAVCSQGPCIFETCEGLFLGYTNLKEIRFELTPDFSRVLSCYAMFAGCNNLEGLTGQTEFDLSAVEEMDMLFSDCSKIAAIAWPVGDNVTSIYGVCRGCISLQTVTLGGSARIRDAATLFLSCMKLTDIDLTGLDLSGLTDTHSMFSGCESLENINTAGWNTSLVTDMHAMFEGCRSIEAIDVSGFNTENVTDMSRMFYNCYRLSRIDIRSFSSASLEDISEMFSADYDVGHLVTHQSSFVPDSVPKNTDWNKFVALGN